MQSSGWGCHGGLLHGHRCVLAARRWLLISGVVSVALALSGCGIESHTRASGARISALASSGTLGQIDPHASSSVAFTTGYSSDPYGASSAKGFGIATGLISGQLRTVHDRDPHLGVSEWLEGGRLIVFDGLRAPALVFGLSGGRLTRLGVAPVSPPELAIDSFAWSPDGKLLAVEPSIRVRDPGARGGGGIAPGRTVFVERADGSDRRPVASGLLSGWTPDGRLVLFSGEGGQFSARTYVTLDLRSGRRRTVLSSGRVAVYAHAGPGVDGSCGVCVGELAYSADGRYLAARALIGSQRALVIARADGSIVRLITSPDVISMFAWSPHGHQLAYTTSGFPAPHKLYVLIGPRARPWRILSQGPHFDWVTWSADDRWLLIDNEHQHAWELLDLMGHQQAGTLAGAAVPTRRLPRLGGAPLWCCPQDHYGGS